MGNHTARQLRAAGHTVIGVDLHDAEVVADLSTPQGRRRAAAEVLARCEGRLDGAVTAAGVGPGRGTERPRLMANVNFLGVVELLEQWRPALIIPGNAKVVVLSSNSTTCTPLTPDRAVRALLARDIDAALRATRLFGPARAATTYAASKIALTRWLRQQAVTMEWAGSGIRLNALAPGAVMTPLLQEQLTDPRQGKAVRSFPVPVGGFGDPAQLARWVCFMLSDAADFLCGSVIFVDGGTDAHFRARDWPRTVPAGGLLAYARRYRNQN